MSGIPAKHARGFRDSYLAYSHEEDVERSHQDLRGPNVADGRKTSHRAQHVGAQLACSADAEVLYEVANGDLVMTPQPPIGPGWARQNAGLYRSQHCC